MRLFMIPIPFLIQRFKRASITAKVLDRFRMHAPFVNINAGFGFGHFIAVLALEGFRVTVRMSHVLSEICASRTIIITLGTQEILLTQMN